MKRLLIIEDEKALREVYVLLFTLQKKYDVHTAANGKEAISVLKEVKPDIVILDLLMPVMGGVELLESVNFKKTYPDAKVLVLSNLSDQEIIDHVRKLGAADYLLKSSVSPAQLLDAINNL